MEPEPRFIFCKSCVAPIDTAMDRYWRDAFKPEKCYCANCILHNSQLQAESEEVITNAGTPKGFKTELDDLEIAPLKTMFVCMHCRRYHISKAILKTLCNSEYFLARLVWRYSIVKDEREYVNLEKVIFYNRKDS